MKYHFTPVKWQLSKREPINSVRKDMEKREPSCTVGWNVNWYRQYGKPNEGGSKS